MRDEDEHEHRHKREHVREGSIHDGTTGDNHSEGDDDCTYDLAREFQPQP